MIEAKLIDGRTLQFPDGTKDEVINKAVREEIAKSPGAGTPAPTPTPTPTPAPAPAEGGFIEGAIKEAPQVGGGIATGLAGTGMAASAAARMEALLAGAGAAAGVPRPRGARVAGTAAGLGTLAGLVALGGASGEAMKQIGQHLSGSPDAPRTSMDAWNRIGKAGLTEGGWELVGGVVAKGFGKILAPFKSRIMEGVVSAIDLFKDKIKPVVFLPAEATETRILDLLQNVAESSIIGGGKIQRFKTERLKFFDDFADSLIDEFGKRTDPSDLGNLFVAALDQNKAVHRKASNILYNSVKAGRTRVSTKSLKNFAGPLQRRGKRLGGIETKNAGDDLVDAIMDLPDDLSYKDATELRSRLISRVDEFSVMNKKAPAIGKAKKLIQLTHKEVEKALKGIPGEAGKMSPLDQWNIANRFYKDGQAKFNNTLLRRLIKLADDTGTGAEMIAPAIFKPGHVSSVRNVKRALGDNPKEWRKMQGFFMEHFMQKSMNIDNNIIGKKILNNMSGKPGSFGLPMLQEILTEPQIRTLRTFGEALQLTQKRQAEGAGKVLIQLTQAGALGTLLTGNLAIPAATIIIAPAIMAKMMLNPTACKLLTTGITMSAKAPEAAGILTRLTAAADRARREDNETE